MLSGQRWIRDRQTFGVRLGLHRMEAMLTVLGHPERRLSFWHIAGTNGKGSVAAVLTAVLRLHYRVGTFVSPAFDGYRGRFTVQGRAVDAPTFERLAGVVRVASETLDRSDPLTEFEALTLMALLHFVEQGVQQVVWETGLGGKYDSTNLVRPLVTGITNVGHDHLEVLGPTQRDVAEQKAGIIKESVPIVTGAEGIAYGVIERVAREQRAPLWTVRRDVAVSMEAMERHGQRFWYRGRRQDVGGLFLPLHGRHQADNLAVALGMLEAADYLPAPALLRLSLAQVVWPLRFEVLRCGSQTVILDGAHNPEGVAALAMSYRSFARRFLPPNARPVIVLGVLAGKPIDDMLVHLAAISNRIVVVAPDVHRALPVEAMLSMLDHGRWQVDSAASVAQGLERARTMSNLVVVCGSLYTVDEARKAMEQHMDSWKLIGDEDGDARAAL
ncbi:folylpolyglutamate synthase/dihydrofolate synthase family protein [Alicyclobacillus sp. SP_1]|uniref:bifunctional folylpolyglutamate synthase/dihydrofolate synthase n=1 Tax=Alicyclobacillus sp. SP_1 TaxID=2942475 RepID=UPI002157668F|nr:Mur ligase family protein [Alicyclobacillus sp. SP_1]